MARFRLADFDRQRHTAMTKLTPSDWDMSDQRAVGHGKTIRLAWSLLGWIAAGAAATVAATAFLEWRHLM
jgi:hypothetical protein